MNIQRNSLYKALSTALILSFSTSTAFANDTTDDPAKTGTGANSIILNEGLDNTTGKKNTASGENAIVGGKSNTADGLNSAVIGGDTNTIKNSKTNNGIFAGLGNTIDNANHRNAIIGGQNSKISGTADRQGFDNVIIGGGDSDKGANEIINGDNNTVIGGYKNVITGVADGDYQDDNIILGGHTNSITETAKDSAILAGTNNTASGLNSVVVGGAKNVASGKGSVVLGGGFYQNGDEIGSTAAALNSSVVGGVNNQIAATAYRSSIMGGYINNVSSIDSTVLGGHHNTVSEANSFILGGATNTVSGALSGAIGGTGNNISGTKSYVIGSSNTVASTVDYVFGESNNIAGSHNYIMGSGNKSTEEKVYILGSNVDASGVANAVVLGDASKAVANAVSVGTEAAPRNIKHVKDGVISDTSLDAINGSQVTTLAETGTTFDNKYISVQRDATQEDGADPHIKKHRKYYKIGLTKEATTAIDNAKEIPQMKTDIAGKVNKTDITGDITSNGGTVTVTGGNDKLLGDVNLEVANGAITIDKLADPVKTKLNNIPSVALITSTDLTVGNGGDLKTGNVNLAIKDGAITLNKLGKDVTDVINLTNEGGITNGGTQGITGGGIYNYLTNNYYNKTQVDDKLNLKVDKSAMSHSMTSNTLTITGGDNQFLKDITVEVKDGAITKNKLNQALKDEIDGKISKSDIHNITSSTLTITGGGANNEGNVANSDVNIEVKDGSITADKLDTNLNTKINSKLSKTDLADSTTVALTEKDGKTEFSVVDGSIGSQQLDELTNNTLKRVGAGFVKSGDKNTITGNVAYDAIKHAKTKVATTGNYLTLKKTESDDVEPNQYTVGLDLDKVKEDLATGSITGTGITVEGGDNSTFKDVKLSITDKAVTKEKLSEGVQTTLNQVTTNKTDIANNKTEIAKKVNTADMNGKLTSQSITVTGAGKDKLLDDVNIEVNKSLTGMQSISFDSGVTISNNGLNNGGHRITNVAAGTNPNDAVNYSQLQGLASRVQNISADANAGIASGIAQANILQPYESGQGVISAGFGYHKGEAALAVGASAISDNRRWILKGSVSANTQSDVSVGGAVGYVWW